ncbi:uncharacterized protein M421DRAFT_121051 [Didymella exigua CBS 183.55]|uniref:Uncharacterized protein n=1 Tax=Didymella exigua CBS 183.55 TaxID=1150837 RepID=A0A6A5S2T6_9PLEO|nr:uncharacterized protein M421DRAFT_121051 [Didymella exigua CBS 183.55]KAF1934432.1 hypothetical protein M421DRAFT_121051 [Didymella exigua CBS 183.55]
MEPPQAAYCNCSLSAVRVLMRIEQFEGVKVPLETLLEVMEDAEVRCCAVLNCTLCSQRRFSLASVTVVSAAVVEWVHGAWLEGGINHTVSLGDVRLDRTDAEMLGRQLMSLQLSHFVKVMARLEGTLSTSTTAHMAIYQDVVRAKMQELQDCKQQVHKYSELP